MCKSHDQLHYQPIMREISAIMCGPGNDVTRDLLLRGATVEGLAWAATQLGQMLSPADLVRVKSRLEAERAAVRSLAAGRVAEHVAASLAETFDEPPF